MIRALAIVAWLALGGSALAAEVDSARPDKVAVTIYRDGQRSGRSLIENADEDAGLVMVTETRTVDLPAGQSRIAFRGVADGIVPQTAATQGIDGALLERNEDFDLLSPGALMAAMEGQPVRRIRTNPKTGKVTDEAAILRAGPNGPVLEINGAVETLGCSGLPERLVFDHVPAGLSDQPTLSMLVDMPTAGRRTITLSYLAVGVSWAADYVARVRPDGKTLDLLGWITLVNRRGTTFADASTQVVAGQLSRSDDTQAVEVEPRGRSDSCWPMGKTSDWVRRYKNLPAPPPMAMPMAAMARGAMQLEDVVVTATRQAILSQLGDYKLYTLPEPTTVAARQVKQSVLLEAPNIPFERVHTSEVTDLGEDFEPTRVLFRFKNDAGSAIGRPLPAGSVTVMEPDPAGGLALTGQANVGRDSPVGVPVELELGEATGVQVQAVHTESLQDASHRLREAYEVRIRNAGAEAAKVELRHSVGRDENFRVVRESTRHTLKGADPLWTLTVPPGGEALLTYAVEFAD